MAAEYPSVAKRERRLGFMQLLSSASCEWFLILLLFVHASLSRLLSSFADYCQLETPCILCSMLGEKGPGCYWNILCNSHRQEISCLVSCSVHDKFADVHSMCDECLSPIVNRNKSSCDSYRLLVGKSLLDVDRSVLQNLVLNKHVRLGSPDHRTCSCCGKTWKAKSGTERLMELNPAGCGASKANVKPPLPRATGRSHFSRRDSLKRLRDKFTVQLTNQPAASVDMLSQVGYTKLRISSDSESEFPFSEDDEDNKSSSGNRQSCSDLIDLSGGSTGKSLSVDVVFDWKGSCEKTSPCLTSPCLTSPCLTSPCLTPGMLSLGDDSRLFDVDGDSNVILPQMQALSVLSEFLSLCTVPPSPNGGEMPMKRSLVEKEVGTPKAKNAEAAIESSSDDTHSLESTNMHQTDETSKLPHSHTLDQTSSSDSAKSEEDTNNPEQVTPSKETISIAHENKQDKPKTAEESSSEAKNDIDYEKSLDGPTLGNTEVENVLERLKRESEQDKNLLANLYRDLEEERNASAIAANQAMAMITRLQEEKAALHMEALQYLRMMEEQAEYDTEALCRANDMLAEKEKEVQDLEIELEFYRNNFLDESSVHNLQSENGVSETKNSSLSSFEEDKVYILRCLEELERKITGSFDGNSNGTSLENEDDVENAVPLSNGKGNDLVRENGFEKEITRLQDRLEALEADRDFVKRTCDVLGGGNDGLELVKEIAQHLQELRKVEFGRRSQFVHHQD